MGLSITASPRERPTDWGSEAVICAPPVHKFDPLDPKDLPYLLHFLVCPLRHASPPVLSPKYYPLHLRESMPKVEGELFDKPKEFTARPRAARAPLDKWQIGPSVIATSVLVDLEYF